jgi:hypothetical protein
MFISQKFFYPSATKVLIFFRCLFHFSILFFFLIVTVLPYLAMLPVFPCEQTMECSATVFISFRASIFSGFIHFSFSVYWFLQFCRAIKHTYSFHSSTHTILIFVDLFGFFWMYFTCVKQRKVVNPFFHHFLNARHLRLY